MRGAGAVGAPAKGRIRADIPPRCSRGALVRLIVIARGRRGADCVGGVGAHELHLRAFAAVGGEVPKRLREVEGRVEDFARLGEIVRCEEVGGEFVLGQAEGGDGAGGEGAHVGYGGEDGGGLVGGAA